MAGSDISSVELVEKWVFKHLSADAFTDEDRREILGDLDEFEEQLVTWGRQLTKCVKIVTTPTEHTIYRRRQGDFRSYLIRKDDTMYCIGVGNRDTTYERDLGQVEQRADAHER